MVLSGSGERIVFVHARAGDESALTGGTIARLRAEGALVVVLYTVTPNEADAQVTSAALAQLGVRAWRSLAPASDVDISGETRDLAATISAAIDELGATAVVIGALDDELRDVTTRVAHAVGLPVFVARTVREAPSQRLIAIDIGDHLDQKLGALGQFSTRWSLSGRTRTGVEGATDLIAETETFLRVASPYSGALAESAIPRARITRITLTNRWLGGLGGLLLGILFGVLGTIAHQATLTLFGVALPVGLTTAFIAIAALLMGLRLVVGNRFVVGLAAMGLLVTIFVLSLRGSAGSVLVPAGLPGTLWTVVPALIAAFVLAWPKLPPRQR